MEDAITTLTTLDYVGIIGGAKIGIAAFKTVVSGIEWFCQKFGIRFKWIEDKKADHELLERTVESINELKEIVVSDEEKFRRKDEILVKQMDEFRTKLKDLSIASSNILNKVNGLESSSELQKRAVVEMLHGVIDGQCDKYINELKGVPSYEVSWLSSRFELYKKMGGNHGLEHKVDYCLEKLPILPD